MDIFDNTILLLREALNLRSARHEILAANIANGDTPGYRALDLAFEKELREAWVSSKGIALVKTNPRHISSALSPLSVAGRIEVGRPVSMGMDQNSVDMDREMVKLAENSLMYEATVQMLIKKFRYLKDAIREGR
ncbi:MAG: flagellar basal body rod protein FlgB [Deltaproteobacteria bacterium]|nr:flagellar basal body rod protein FlgB [Deltaproteobacteria bacterium]MBW2123539.1 flagellar basal body rod protein FlgB [Deltaproteobacteria bacterium]